MSEKKPESKVHVIRSAFTIRIIWVLLGLFFLITVISQIYIRFYNPLYTEVAMIYTTSDTLSFKGVHIRNERLVRYGGADVISYIHPDGSKLGRNSVVAQSYRSVEDILLQRRIDTLTEQIKLLEAAETLANTDKSQLEAYNNQITGRQVQLLRDINSGNFSSVGSFKDDYISMQSRRRVLRGDEADFKQRISNINSEILTLRTRMGSSPRDVTIDEAGYFVSTVDGYEGSLNFDNLNVIKKGDIERIIREPLLDDSPSNDIIGKMVDGYKWRFVGIIDTERVRVNEIHKDRIIDFRTGGNAQIVQAVVLSVRDQGDGTSIVIFECDTLTAEFASRRVSQFSIILDSRRGIRVPTSAIHIGENFEQGVFVQNGAELVFRRIRTIGDPKEDYFLVEDTTGVPGFISLYDSVVVRGTDLYDGKIVQ